MSETTEMRNCIEAQLRMDILAGAGRGWSVLEASHAPDVHIYGNPKSFSFVIFSLFSLLLNPLSPSFILLIFYMFWLFVCEWHDNGVQ